MAVPPSWLVDQSSLDSHLEDQVGDGYPEGMDMSPSSSFRVEGIQYPAGGLGLSFASETSARSPYLFSQMEQMYALNSSAPSASYWDQSRVTPWNPVDSRLQVAYPSVSQSFPGTNAPQGQGFGYAVSEAGSNATTYISNSDYGLNDPSSVPVYNGQYLSRPQAFRGDPVRRLHGRRGSTAHQQHRNPSPYQNRSRDPRASPQPCHYFECDYVARTTSQFRKHITAHERPFVCSHAGCPRTVGFTTKNDLERHNWSVHKIMPACGFAKGYKCAATDCKDKYRVWARRDNYKAHAKNMHAREDDFYLTELIIDSEQIITAAMLAPSSGSSSTLTAPTLADPTPAVVEQNALDGLDLMGAIDMGDMDMGAMDMDDMDSFIAFQDGDKAFNIDDPFKAYGYFAAPDPLQGAPNAVEEAAFHEPRIANRNEHRPAHARQPASVSRLAPQDDRTARRAIASPSKSQFTDWTDHDFW